MEMCIKPVKGSLRIYNKSEQVFVLFILSENEGFAVCWAIGDRQKEPMGESFEKIVILPSLENAMLVLNQLENMANDKLLSGPPDWQPGEYETTTESLPETPTLNE